MQGAADGRYRTTRLYAAFLEGRHLARHKSVAVQRLAALSLGEKGAGPEVRPGVYFRVGDDEAVALLDAADYLRDATVVAPEVAEFFIGEDERVRHFVIAVHCFGG